MNDYDWHELYLYDETMFIVKMIGWLFAAGFGLFMLCFIFMLLKDIFNVTRGFFKPLPTPRTYGKKKKVEKDKD